MDNKLNETIKLVIKATFVWQIIIDIIVFHIHNNTGRNDIKGKARVSLNVDCNRRDCRRDARDESMIFKTSHLSLARTFADNVWQFAASMWSVRFCMTYPRLFFCNINVAPPFTRLIIHHSPQRAARIKYSLACIWSYTLVTVNEATRESS